jgi:hypothetical protein
VQQGRQDEWMGLFFPEWLVKAIEARFELKDFPFLHGPEKKGFPGALGSPWKQVRQNGFIENTARRVEQNNFFCNRLHTFAIELRLS